MTGVTMSRGGAASSQIGLFSTQISEQIVRLRAIENGKAGEVGQTDAVALKRAVMATRLLAGSARILRLESLQHFLDQLLIWLQHVEARSAPITPTENMMLESVIDLEESLMDSIDEAEDVDLSVYDQDLSELLTMMARHSQEPAASGPQSAVPDAADAPPTAEVAPPPPAAAPPVAPSSAAPPQAESPSPATPPAPTADAPPPPSVPIAPLPHRSGPRLPTADTAPPPPVVQKPTDREIALTDALAALISELEVFRHEEGRRAISLDGRDSLAILARRLVDVVDSLAPREAASDPSESDLGSLIAETLEPHEAPWPRDDEFLDPLWRHLNDQGERMGMEIQFHVDGDAASVDVGMRDVTGQILKYLLDDISGRFQQAVYASEELGGFPRVTLDIRRNHGRLEFILRDNAPSIDNRAALLGEDDLSFYRGLRRSRVLIQQLGGMVRVEPEGTRDRRFTLTLPAELQLQSYKLMRLGGETVAVPWVAMESETSVNDVRLETDNSGESFERDGHTVALVDLSGWAQSAGGRAAEQETIAVLGSVERRVGILCEGLGELVEAKTLGDPPGNWGLVAAGSLELGKAWIPVLDVRRILRLRFSTSGADDLSGSLNDPLLDSYVPVQTPARPTAPTPTTPSLRVLLVNQSEFRRRDLARTLEDMGHLVTTAKDLDTAATHGRPDVFDLVVTDLRLGQQGADRVVEIREGAPGVPIVLTSAVAKEQAEELAAKVGASSCWLEPYRRSDLAQILRELA